MSYKVTVIIPTYNSEEFLDSTIGSIKEQTFGFENIEVIIVDDYSTDNTQKMIDDYCNKYENIKTFESGKKTGTPGRARNIAINKASADYIMFIDHDDKYLPETVEKLYNAIIDNKSQVAIGKFQTFGDNYIVTEDWITEDVILNSIDENLLFFSINNIWRMIFPKEFLIKNNITFPEGVFAEDLTFMIDSFINANKIVFINDIIYNFRLRTGETTSTSLSKGMHYLNGLIDGYKDTVKVLEKKNGLKYYDRVFNQHLSRWLSDVALSETISKEDKLELINKSIPLFKRMENVNPFPENNAIKNIILEIKEENIAKAFSLMNDYNLSTRKALENGNKRSKKRWLKNKAKAVKNKILN